MPVTVIESIALELTSRLEAMIGDDTYETEVREVIRPRRLNDYTPADGQIVVVQGDSEVVEDLSHGGNPPAIARRQTFNIRCHIINDERSRTTIDEITNTFAADVIKAVCLPAATWHQFDGNAIDATWQPYELVSGDGGLDGVNVPIAILYRTDEDNPYIARA
jgi:hypothetical protein